MENLKNSIEQIVLESGLWNGDRRKTHQFLLSPNVYEVTEAKKKVLESIGFVLEDCLVGLSRIATIATDPHLSSGKAWDMIAKTFRVGIPKIYSDLIGLKPKQIPLICKVDLLEDTDGNYFLAEIDGHNKHGMGYTTLFARIRKVISPQASSFQGVTYTVAERIKEKGFSEIVFLYSERERFYYPEFQIFKSELLKEHGINVVLVSENEVEVCNGKMFTVGDREITQQFFVDFPFLYENNKLCLLLAEKYKEGKIDFLIPPKPFFGSKVLLGLLRNDEENKDIEAILRSHIPSKSLETIRRHIPKTYLMDGKEKEPYWRSRMNGTAFVLKECISSGSKGTVFSNSERFNILFPKAIRAKFQYVMQEAVPNKSYTLPYFSETGGVMEKEWNTRIIVYYSRRCIADIVVTACEDNIVHGGPNALMFGTTLV